MRAIARFSILLVLTGCATFTLPAPNSIMLIENDPGGNVEAYKEKYEAWAKTPGLRVEINRWCASACTQVFSYLRTDQICLSPRAKVGFHSISTKSSFPMIGMRGNPVTGPGMIDDGISTLLMVIDYPPWMQAYLRNVSVMGLSREAHPAIIPAEEFWFHGYSDCRKWHVSTPVALQAVR